MIDWSWKTIQPWANLVRDLTAIDEPAGTTSIYCCVLGDAAVCGLQGPFEGRYGIAVRDFGEVHDAPVFRTRVDWYVGFAVCNRKAAARLYNVAPMPLVLP